MSTQENMLLMVSNCKYIFFSSSSDIAKGEDTILQHFRLQSPLQDRLPASPGEQRESRGRRVWQTGLSDHQTGWSAALRHCLALYSHQISLMIYKIVFACCL